MIALGSHQGEESKFLRPQYPLREGKKDWIGPVIPGPLHEDKKHFGTAGVLLDMPFVKVL